MDNAKRAEKIVDTVYNQNWSRASHVTYVLAQLDEAVREASICTGHSQELIDQGFASAQKECEKMHITLTQNHYWRGFNEAVEKAAGIADLHSSQSFGYSKEIREASKDLAERIRNMTSETSKESK